MVPDAKTFALLTATELARTAADALQRVTVGRETLVITRLGRPIAILRPIDPQDAGPLADILRTAAGSPADGRTLSLPGGSR